MEHAGTARETKRRALTRPFLLSFLDPDLEQKFTMHYAVTMYRRRLIYVVLIIAGLLVTGFSVGRYHLIYEEGIELTVVSSLSLILYGTSRFVLGVLVCANPADNWRRYNVARWIGVIALTLVHVWMVCMISPALSLSKSQGVKLPVVQAFSDLGEMLFYGFHFFQLLPLILVHSVDLLVWEFRCATPLNGFFVVFVYGLMCFLLWDREATIRGAWASSLYRERAVLETQRNAAHDIRNDLQEVLGLVELSNSTGIYKDITGDGDGGHNPETLRNLRENDARSDEVNGSLRVEIIDENPKTLGSMPFHTRPPFKVARSVSDTSLTLRPRLKKLAIDKSHSDLDPDRSQRPGSPTLGADEVKSRVRRAAGRIRHRLDTGLRDTTTVIQRKDLLPTIETCDLAELVRTEVASDRQIEFFISPDFPKQVQTDSAWIRSCVANLVGNAKKHGGQGPIQVQLLWDPRASSIRFEVTDSGSGVTEAQARALFRDHSRVPVIKKSGNGIGLQAVKTYIRGLGGMVGAERSTFWFRLPVSHRHTKMHPVFLTFQGGEETNFRKHYLPSPSVFIVSYGLFSVCIFFLVALIFLEARERYYCYYTGSFQQRGSVISNATLGFQNSSPSSGHDDDVTGSVTASRLKESVTGIMGFDIWLIMIPCVSVGALMGWRLWRPASTLVYSIALIWIYISFIGTDIAYITTLAIAIRRSPAEFNPIDMVSSVVAIMRQIVLTPTGGFPFKHTCAVFLTPLITRTVIVFIAPTAWLQLAFFVQAIIATSTLVACWYLESLIRVKYQNSFRQLDFKRNQRTLERVAKVFSLEAKQEAQSNAAHEVSGCFNTLLTAALEMQTYLQTQLRAKRFANGVEEIPEALAASFEMITEAQDDFSFLQNTPANRGPLETNHFHVRVMLENAARVFKYGARNGMVIQVSCVGQVSFESSVAHLRQILQQLMRALGGSDRLEIDGCLVFDSRFGERVLRMGVSSSFNFDLPSVERTRPDLKDFHQWNNASTHTGEKNPSVKGELFDVIRRVSQLEGVIDSKFVCRTGMKTSKEDHDVTVFTVHVFIPRGSYNKEKMKEQKSQSMEDLHLIDDVTFDASDVGSLPSTPALSFSNAMSSRSRVPRRLLLVDDNDFVLDVCEMQLRSLLDHHGLSDVQLDTCAKDVLPFLLSHEEYGLVFMDLNFPGTPEGTTAGLFVMSEFKKLRPFACTKFIAFSGDSGGQTTKACEAAGMIKPFLLVKPMQTDTVVGVLERIFSGDE
jgi:signal transduction histidine kinase/CheY-like chemotaxis protein